jgi:hypothetical protein
MPLAAAIQARGIFLHGNELQYPEPFVVFTYCHVIFEGLRKRDNWK